MSTFVFKNKEQNFTPVSNVFIENYMPKARGEFIKVYLLGLKYCLSGEVGVTSSIIAANLHLLESDVLNAWNYWNEENVIKLTSKDNNGNYSIEFMDLTEESSSENKIDLLKELDNDTIKFMLQDIEKILGRTLSSNEMTLYISWLNELNFTPELILLLIQYCVAKGKSDYRYIEKLALSWHDNKIKTIDDAQSYIKKHEDKWLNIRKILTYLGIRDSDIMKPQEDLFVKWLESYNFSVDVICKACDICFQRLNKAEFKYIDGILTSWFKDGIKTIEDVDKKDFKKTPQKNFNNGNNRNKTPNLVFNSYEQREYNFDDLEKKLLGWDKDDK